VGSRNPGRNRRDPGKVVSRSLGSGSSAPRPWFSDGLSALGYKITRVLQDTS